MDRKVNLVLGSFVLGAGLVSSVEGSMTAGTKNIGKEFPHYSGQKTREAYNLYPEQDMEVPAPRIAIPPLPRSKAYFSPLNKLDNQHIPPVNYHRRMMHCNRT